MKRSLLAAAVFMLACGIMHPPAAEARVFVGFNCCGYGYGYPYPYYPPAYYPYYVAPPPVVYTVPPPPQVIYSAPPQQVVVAAPPAPAASANQTSPTFIDSQGRTCRQFQSTTPGGAPYGTACLQPDGSWRAVQ